MHALRHPHRVGHLRRQENNVELVALLHASNRRVRIGGSLEGEPGLFEHRLIQQRIRASAGGNDQNRSRE
jgi:hypothetical protein